MLTPPFIALLCRTFITLEGLLAEDELMASSYNVYETSLPFAVCRLLSPRTLKGQRELRSSFLKPNSSQVDFKSLGTLAEQGEPGAAQPAQRLRFDLGTARAVQRRLLLTAEGTALRRICFQVDAFEATRRACKSVSIAS